MANFVSLNDVNKGIRCWINNVHKFKACHPDQLALVKTRYIYIYYSDKNSWSSWCPLDTNRRTFRDRLTICKHSCRQKVLNVHISDFTCRPSEIYLDSVKEGNLTFMRKS